MCIFDTNMPASSNEDLTPWLWWQLSNGMTTKRHIADDSGHHTSKRIALQKKVAGRFSRRTVFYIVTKYRRIFNGITVQWRPSTSCSPSFRTLTEHWCFKRSLQRQDTTGILHVCHNIFATQSGMKVTGIVFEISWCVFECSFTEAVSQAASTSKQRHNTLLLVESSSSQYLGYCVKERKLVVRFPVETKPFIFA